VQDIERANSLLTVPELMYLLFLSFFLEFTTWNIKFRDDTTTLTGRLSVCVCVWSRDREWKNKCGSCPKRRDFWENCNWIISSLPVIFFFCPTYFKRHNCSKCSDALKSSSGQLHTQPWLTVWKPGHRWCDLYVLGFSWTEVLFVRLNPLDAPNPFSTPLRLSHSCRTSYHPSPHHWANARVNTYILYTKQQHSNVKNEAKPGVRKPAIHRKSTVASPKREQISIDPRLKCPFSQHKFISLQVGPMDF